MTRKVGLATVSTSTAPVSGVIAPATSVAVASTNVVRTPYPGRIWLSSANVPPYTVRWATT